MLRASDLGFRVSGLGVYGLRIQGSGCRVSDFGLRVYGLGLTV